ncbi:hypothetical protein GpartN1_g7331.t1 [Galdieria partita]|uniref:Uncharacterized protein n=1 Tax=Galdieria partita TaxID=83374 RepID=A0A9C7Q4A8_9RHOD|nr:hypothetical protein GpartN1_g7331.t1 [Galdieria partita]
MSVNVLDCLKESSATPRRSSFFDKFQVAYKLHCLDEVTVENEWGTLSTVTAIDIDLAEGRYALAGDVDGSIYLYDLFPYFHSEKNNNNCITIRCLCHSNGTEANRIGGVSCIRWFTADNGMFFSIQELWRKTRISIWDTNLFTEEQVIEYQDSPIYQLAPCPAGATKPLLAIGTNKKVLLLDLRVGQRAVQQLRGWDSGVSCVEWCPYVEYCLATGTLNGDLSLVDWRKPEQNNRLVTMNPYRSFCLNSNQPVLIKPLSQGNDILQKRLSWSPSSTVHFWSPSFYQQWSGHKRKQKIDKVVGDGPSNVLLKQSEQVYSSEQTPLHRAHSCSVECIRFLWSCRYLSSLDREGNIQIWDTLTGCLEHSLTCSCLPNKQKKKDTFHWISVGWDNKTLFYALDRNLYCFDAIHGNHMTTIQTIGSKITALTSHPWEPLLLCGSTKDELILFGVEDNIYLEKQLPLGVTLCQQK